MNTQLHQTLSALLAVLLFSSFSVQAQTFEDRRQQYIDSALVNPNESSIIIQAYEGVTVDQSVLDTIYNEMQTRSTIDFKIVELIRVMLLSNGAFDSEMIPILNSVPYWVNYSDTIRGYWSENHMIMWMSSDWIIHEYTGRPIDATLEQRLKHYLNLKIEYGFFEYFSATYLPYTLSGLLNLADFAQDQEIKSLAIQASKKLLSDILMVTNNNGVYYPAAGRNFPSKYLTPYGQNHNRLIWLLTGMGEAPSSASHSGSFLATTTVDFSDVASGWTSSLDTVYEIGHTLQEGFVINQNQSDVDRIMFQWSSGSYFHPEVVTETVSLLVDSNMWNHVDFDLLRPLSGFPLDFYPGLSEGLSEISKSSVNVHAEIAIFKNEGVTLCSNQDFWKGKVGFQQFPFCANTGTSAVYSASGEVQQNWLDRNTDNMNEHLPYVEQSSNVALVMYRHEPTSVVLPFDNKEVALHWVDTVFDETVEDGNWLLGREEDGYVAVRRHCTGVIDGVRACPEEPGQTWVFVVGNENMYGSFANFQTVVSNSTFSEEWLVTLNGDSTYYASIDLDNQFIEHYWDPESFVGVDELSKTESFKLWPNPTSQRLNVDLSGFKENLNVTVINGLGQQVYNENVSSTNQLNLDVSNWKTGIYSVTIKDDQQILTQRFVKK